MKARNVLTGIQLASLLGGLASAEYLRRAGKKARDRNLRQVRAMHDNRYDEPIRISDKRFQFIGTSTYYLLGGLFAARLQRRHPELLTVLSVLVAVGSGAMSLILRYEFIKSDDVRVEANHRKVRWPYAGVADIAEQRRRHDEAA